MNSRDWSQRLARVGFNTLASIRWLGKLLEHTGLNDLSLAMATHLFPSK